MTTTFDRAIAEIVPVLYPDFLYRLNADGEPQFPDFAAKVRPTPFAPGVTKGTGTMAPADWMVRWAEGLEPTPRNLTLRSLLGGGGDTGSRTLPLPHPAVSDAARQGLGGPRLHGDAGATGRRSTRARNSGATTSARRSRTGRRSTSLFTARRRALPRTSSGASCCGASS